jgi:single-strand selective monofunctional uracil DNA glycosylase
LPASEQRLLSQACDRHLIRALELLAPKWAVGVGGFATQCLRRVAPASLAIATILHPSPASPAANRGWAETALRQLRLQSVWS